ncbi:uncharacterized protein DUF4932 [Pontibacter ummariensis]|uniref:DUF4932 domain-containing protein n=1 Tax=Pontibacter ummariensis TaxID=1610492 RepID=A0A239HMC1_9BACT|nr:DUF4932 domain-containing protein [Pontibacter ummariensis]PRY10334.1 uncharacterized protein DUF4932 [Pontibacter ummariensis]SNS82490.1 protein of unknown function [Pontibacter ummariensis]
MKKSVPYVTAAALALGFTTCLAQKTQELPSINSNVETITYVLNSTDRHAGWRISPEQKPDRLSVECKQKVTKVAFVTDVDSIEFLVKEGDTVRFYVQQAGREKALTEIVGVPKNVNFSKKYIRENEGKFAVEVPEVHELANILVAISNIGQQDSNMVDMTTPYHKEVMAHFSPYKNHPIMDVVNKHITKVFDKDSYWYYYAMKMNACAYVFDKNGSIKNAGIIRKMGFDNQGDPILANLALLEDFARKSNFREFYKQHQPYYNDLVKTYHALNPIDQQQAWLEDKFKFKYGNYLVTFSPLVGGAHSTMSFEDNGFEQTVMFVRRADLKPEYNEKVNEMRNSRVVFTEIDHNFVNPTSDKYAAQINEVFGDRAKWVVEGNGTSAYSSPYNVFNEYMTWSVYSLYCLDKFSAEDNATFIPLMVNQMEKKRGFVRFGDFNQKLLSLYKANPKISIDELYTSMLDWSKVLQ